MTYEVVTDVCCPFCGLPVLPIDTTQDKGIPVYGCVNPNCEESEDLVGTIEMWYHLVVVAEEMNKGRKNGEQGHKADGGSVERDIKQM